MSAHTHKHTKHTHTHTHIHIQILWSASRTWLHGHYTAMPLTLLSILYPRYLHTQVARKNTFQSARLHAHLLSESICPYTCLSVYLSVFVSVRLRHSNQRVSMRICSLSLSVLISVCLSTCLSLRPSVSLDPRRALLVAGPFTVYSPVAQASAIVPRSESLNCRVCICMYVFMYACIDSQSTVQLFRPLA
jgi:hypothetical protein